MAISERDITLPNAVYIDKPRFEYRLGERRLDVASQKEHRDECTVCRAFDNCGGRIQSIKI